MVHIYVGGPAGDPAASGNITVADRDSDVGVKNSCGGGEYHRYRLSIPNWQSKIGQLVYAYGISINGGNNSLLLNSGMPVQ